VKSFTNEEIEQQKFAYENRRFLDSRRDGYRSEAYFDSGMIISTHLITIAVVVFGGAAILNGALALPELVTFLLCVAILTEPIRRVVNFARLYHEGFTGFIRFMEIL